MTMEKGQLILVNDFLNTINAGLKDKIQAEAKWSVATPPPDAVYAVTSKLKPNTSLTPISESDKIKKRKLMKSSSIYDALQTIFKKWCCVRRLNYTYRWGGWNNGGSIPYGQRSHSGYANLKSEVAQNITDKEVKALVIDGQLIKPDYTAKFCTKLYEAWKKIAEEHHVDITYTSCHRNCHDNCHGSGGWR